MRQLLNLFVIACCFNISCSKEEVPNVDFDVTVAFHQVKVDEEVQFNFTGNPDIIAFYSGEVSSNYDFLTTDNKFDADVILSFTSAKYSGNNSDPAHLKYSVDFNGSYDSTSIANANWTDITDRFFIPNITPTAIFYPSGDVDISDIIENENKPVYFAWFFETKANSGRTLFRVDDWQIKYIAQDDETITDVKYTHSNSLFKMILGSTWAGLTTDIPNVNNTQIVWTGVFNNVTRKQGWAVTAPLYLEKEINFGRAHSVGIKSMNDGRLNSYRYAYSSPGTYKVVFVAANSTIYDRKEVIREVTIVVEP